MPPSPPRPGARPGLPSLVTRRGGHSPNRVNRNARNHRARVGTKAGHTGHPLRHRSTRPQSRDRATAPVRRQLECGTSYGSRQANGDGPSCQRPHSATRKKESTPPDRGPWHRDTVVGAASQPSSSSIEAAMAVHFIWTEGEVSLTRTQGPTPAAERLFSAPRSSMAARWEGSRHAQRRPKRNVEVPQPCRVAPTSMRSQHRVGGGRASEGAATLRLTMKKISPSQTSASRRS